MSATRHAPGARLVLRPYQREASEFLARTPRALLALDTRLGKTFIALHAAIQVGATRILVICPAIGRLSWALEAPLCGDFNVQVVRPNATVNRLGAGPVLLIISYDALSRADGGWAEILSTMSAWDVMILDEAQALKNIGARRTQAVYGQVRANAHRIWLLTGTPTPNHAGEIWPHVSALWPECGVPKTRHEFEDKYCKVENTVYGRRIAGSRNQAELRDRLAPFVLRRRKSDVIPEMPKMSHNMVPLDMRVVGAPELDEDELEKLLASPGPAGVSLQHSLGDAKAPYAVLWLQEQLAMNIISKVVVFAWHRSVLDVLMTGLADFEPVRIDGATSDTERVAAIEAFQNDPNCRVFIGQIRACGTAICLDQAEDAVMVEPSWVPADNYQAACRIEDVARTTAVTVSWLYAPDSLDQRIMASLRGKTREISQLWD